MEPGNVQIEKRITAKRVITTSFVVDLIDVITNLVIVLLSGSVIILTEFLEGVSDLAASGLLLLGLRRSLREADKSHPFGYGREIYFWTLIAALLMFGLTATLSMYFGYQRFRHPQPIHNTTLVMVILVLGLATNGYALWLSFKRLLRKQPLLHVLQIFYRSSLIETKTTFILDLMGAVAALLGTIALGIYLTTGDMRFDGIGAMVIGVALAIAAVFLVEGIHDLLVGRSASLETEAKIQHAALTVPEVEEVLDIKTLHIGSEKLLVNLDVHMKGRLTTRELEKLIDTIKEHIRKEVPSVVYLQIELETPRK